MKHVWRAVGMAQCETLPTEHREGVLSLGHIDHYIVRACDCGEWYYQKAEPYTADGEWDDLRFERPPDDCPLRGQRAW